MFVHQHRHFCEEDNDAEMKDIGMAVQAYFLSDLVKGTLESSTARNRAINPEMKAILTLRYHATRKMQKCSSYRLPSK